MDNKEKLNSFRQNLLFFKKDLFKQLDKDQKQAKKDGEEFAKKLNGKSYRKYALEQLNKNGQA